MKYIVVKTTARKSEDIARFDSKKDANSFAEFANATVRVGTRYKVEERE